MLKKLLFLAFFIAPSANFSLLAQVLGPVFEADSTQQWWVTDRVGNVYFGWVRRMGTDSVRVIQGKAGSKMVAMKDVRRVKPKGEFLMPTEPRPGKTDFQNYKGIVLYNAMPHKPGVTLRVHQIIYPELEVRFRKGHLFAVGSSIHRFGRYGRDFEPVFYRYRYQVNINKRLKAALGVTGARFSRIAFRYQASSAIVSSLLTLDYDFFQFTTGSLTYVRKEQLGSSVPCMLQLNIPKSRFSLSYELYYTGQVRNRFIFDEKPSPWTSFVGAQYNGRIVCLQAGHIPSNYAIRSEYYNFSFEYFLSLGFHLYRPKARI
jgi:hypothetical protein